MNWRLIIGLSLLLVGVLVMYSALATTDPTGHRPVAPIVGGVIWACVGLYLLVKGMTKNEEKL